MLKHLAGFISVLVSIMGLSNVSFAAAANYDVIGRVPQICAVDQPQLQGGTAAVNATIVSGQTILINQLTDPTTLATNAASFDISFDAMCNYAHRLVVESQNNGLWPNITTSGAPGFGNAVPYSADILWADTNATMDADASVRQIKDVSIPVGRPAEGQIELRFKLQPGASNAQLFSPLLAGTYRDVIRVTVEPQ